MCVHKMEVFRRGQIMARPRKPTAQLELEGAFKKNPQRKRIPHMRIGDQPSRNPEGESKHRPIICFRCALCGL